MRELATQGKILEIKSRTKIDKKASREDLSKFLEEIQKGLNRRPLKVALTFDKKSIQDMKKYYLGQLKGIEKQIQQMQKKVSESQTKVTQNKSKTGGLLFNAQELKKNKVDYIKGLDDIEKKVKQKYKSMGEVTTTAFKNNEGQITKVIAKIRELDKETGKATGKMKEYTLEQANIQYKKGTPKQGFVATNFKNIDKINEYERKEAQKTARQIEADKMKTFRLRVQEAIKLENIKRREAQKTQRQIEQGHMATHRARVRDLLTTQSNEEKLNLFRMKMETDINKLKSSTAGKFLSGSQLQGIKELQQRMAGLTPNTHRLGTQMRVIREELRRYNTEAQTASNNSMKLGDSLKEAFTKFPLWLGVSTIVMGTFRAFSEGVKYVKEMNDALTDLAKVTTFTEVQLNGMKEAAVDLGQDLGRSSVDIMKSFAEFGRVAKDMQDIQNLSKSAILASNVTTMTAETSAKAINTAMIAFKLEAKDSMKIIDQWNELKFVAPCMVTYM